MKVQLVVAATAEEASEALANNFKVSAPRKVKIRHGGDSQWRAMQKKAKVYYRKNKTKLSKQKKLYRKRNANRLSQRREFLKHAPKSQVVNPNVSVASIKKS